MIVLSEEEASRAKKNIVSKLKRTKATKINKETDLWIVEKVVRGGMLRGVKEKAEELGVTRDQLQNRIDKVRELAKRELGSSIPNKRSSAIPEGLDLTAVEEVVSQKKVSGRQEGSWSKEQEMALILFGQGKAK